MRPVVLCLALATPIWAQFKSTTQLVNAPTTVTDSKGRFVDGLTADDLILTDNSVRQPIQMDWMTYPIDLVVAVQTSADSGPVIDKLGGTGMLFSQMLAGGTGETAMISFSDTVKLHQDFTADSDAVRHAMRMLRMEGGDAHALDAIGEALRMLGARPAGRRRIILMIAEKRDRGSSAALPDVMALAQRLNTAIYWVTWSPFLQPFTVKNKVKEDLKPIDERRPFPYRDETPVPYEPGPGGVKYALGEPRAYDAAGSIGLIHCDHGRSSSRFCQKGCARRGDRAHQPGGASSVHPDVPGAGRSAWRIPFDSGVGETESQTAGHDTVGILDCRIAAAALPWPQRRPIVSRESLTFTGIAGHSRRCCIPFRVTGCWCLASFGANESCGGVVLDCGGGRELRRCAGPAEPARLHGPRPDVFADLDGGRRECEFSATDAFGARALRAGLLARREADLFCLRPGCRKVA